MNYEPYWAIAKARAALDPAHDFLHVQRVFQNAERILQRERADETVVLPAILLHELFNYPKGHPDSSKSGDICAEHAGEVLAQLSFPVGKTDHVLACIRNHSFSKGITPDTIEGKIVQDADRLDAIGAIGIARCFASCAEMGRPFYDSDDPFARDRSPNDKEFGIDHFFMKLLRIADGLHTATAQTMASERTTFMKSFLQQLDRELS